MYLYRNLPRSKYEKNKTVIQQEVTELVCDGCGLEAHVHKGYEFSEFISIEHKSGFGAIHHDSKELSIDLYITPSSTSELIDPFA
ncbi:hypothetical protein tloyanaT_08170 [Thalassotalea loyana]|uniref:Uncharacterized protein n=1 Tax=Thalassotalea loyana TaxID=280483 RepID=A0ABQ6HCW2_9GAMM|nr:hypothetical protein [Thalassotalea loyana]GLX84565.1 hypothetical protein tloyanaT_08170 [Thalassotalea loyana]